MNQKKLIRDIKKSAAQDRKNRNDIRYKNAVAFLTKKGFLKTNQHFAQVRLGRLKLSDFIWAGKKVEPRILEVLPAAVARLPRAFIIDNDEDTIALLKTVYDLKSNSEVGSDFLNIPYNKLKVWMNIILNDKRTKVFDEKKKLVTFRLSSAAILKIKEIATKENQSEANVIESLLLKDRKARHV